MHAKTLGICNNCNTNDGKYRCPRCKTVSCSLQCCNEHKSKMNCNGIKDKVEFIPLSQMNGDVLRKDIRFLTNLSSKMHVSRREPLLHSKEDRNTHNRFMSVCSAAKFKKIRLFLQPSAMAKHQNNKTYTTKAVQAKHTNGKVLKRIHWSMSVQFGSHQLLLHDIDEDKTLLSVLRNLKQQKFQRLSLNTVITKIMHQNRIFEDGANDNDEDNDHNMEIEYKEDILDKYQKYLNDINLIHLPSSAKRRSSKHRKNESVSDSIARLVLEERLFPKLWDIVSINDKDKMNIILKIPNHFMYIRINPNQSILCILKQKIINEYPEFVVLTPDEMKRTEYVVIDYMDYHQFGNSIKYNTKIQMQRQKLQMEMNHKLNEKKLFHRNNNRFHNKSYGKRSNVYKKKDVNALKPNDLFNGNIVPHNPPKRSMNQMDNYGVNQPQMKRMRYEQNNQNRGNTFNNPFNLNNFNHNKPHNQQQQKDNSDWYLYL